MKQLLGIGLLCCLLAACGGNDSVGTGGTSRSATGSYADSSAAMAPCAAIAEQYPPLEDRVAALQTAADSGEACAQYGLGTLYETGYETIDPDPELARHYLTLAAAQGHSAAARELQQHFSD